VHVTAWHSSIFRAGPVWDFRRRSSEFLRLLFGFCFSQQFPSWLICATTPASSPLPCLDPTNVISPWNAYPTTLSKSPDIRVHVCEAASKFTEICSISDFSRPLCQLWRYRVPSSRGRQLNQDHHVSYPRDLLAHLPTRHDRSHKTFTPKRRALFAPLTHQARLPPLILRASTRDHEADTRGL
jgi:hypothetical protein